MIFRKKSSESKSFDRLRACCRKNETVVFDLLVKQEATRNIPREVMLRAKAKLDSATAQLQTSMYVAINSCDPYSQGDVKKQMIECLDESKAYRAEINERIVQAVDSLWSSHEWRAGTE